MMQTLLDRAPQATWYFSDDFSTYHTLVYYPGRHRAMTDKSQTYSVEGVNADLRHYLARLGRRSRCFSRCPHALRCTLQLFVYCHNHRQLYKQRYPKYPSHPIDFISPLC
jgi:IS1 family transposase